MRAAFARRPAVAWRVRAAFACRPAVADGSHLPSCSSGPETCSEGNPEGAVKKDGPVRGGSPGRKEGMRGVLAPLLLCKGNKQWSGRRGAFVRHVRV